MKPETALKFAGIFAGVTFLWLVSCVWYMSYLQVTTDVASKTYFGMAAVLSGAWLPFMIALVFLGIAMFTSLNGDENDEMKKVEKIT